MPSFVIHYITGNKLLNDIKMNEDDKLLFLLGNLIPDSSKNNKKDIQKEKLITHFRRIEDSNTNLMAPYPNDFLDKYKDLINNPTVLGYFYHLWIDRYYLKEIFTNNFEFLDKDYNKTDYLDKTVFVKIKKNNNIITRKELFSYEYLYDDYTTINNLLLKKYKIEFNEDNIRKVLPKFKNPGIEEVDYNNVEQIISDMKIFIEESKKRNNNELKVLDKNEIINFIEESPKIFIKENKELLKKYKYR